MHGRDGYARNTLNLTYYIFSGTYNNVLELRRIMFVSILDISEDNIQS